MNGTRAVCSSPTTKGDHHGRTHISEAGAPDDHHGQCLAGAPPSEDPLLPVRFARQ